MENEDQKDEERAIKNATNRVEIAKARVKVIQAAESFVQMTKQGDPEGEAEFLRDLVATVEALHKLEHPEPNECKHENREFNNSCGALVCDDCGSHWGMARCFCGWSASGGDGLAELEEMGENIEGP